MSDHPFDPDAVCKCGAKGAFDVMGDMLCAECVKGEKPSVVWVSRKGLLPDMITAYRCKEDCAEPIAFVLHAAVVKLLECVLRKHDRIEGLTMDTRKVFSSDGLEEAIDAVQAMLGKEK